MTKRSAVSKVRQDLKRKHLVDQLAAAYYQKTQLDPTSTQLVTQEVHDPSGKLIGINWWLEPKKDVQVANFLYNATRAVYEARRRGDQDGISQALDFIDKFFDDQLNEPGTEPNVDASPTGQPSTDI